MTPDYQNDEIFLILRHNYLYTIYLHDENYFWATDSTYSVPLILIKLNPNTTVSHYYQIVLTEVEELNLPEDPCDAQPFYNFNACIKESLSRRVGCRTVWDLLSDQSRPLCTNNQQFG